jgi:hypothetical protein
MALSDEQSQELMDAIIEKCEQMGLSVEEIIDGLGWAMKSATEANGTSGAVVTIENYGLVKSN